MYKKFIGEIAWETKRGRSWREAGGALRPQCRPREGEKENRGLQMKRLRLWYSAKKAFWRQLVMSLGAKVTSQNHTPLWNVFHLYPCCAQASEAARGKQASSKQTHQGTAEHHSWARDQLIHPSHRLLRGTYYGHHSSPAS